MIWELRFFASLLLTFGLTSVIGFAADSPGQETFRVVHLHVLEVDGAPAAHRDVYLRGWERRALGPIDGNEKETRNSGWLKTTDAQGHVTFRIGNFAGWLDKSGRPGWGTYGFQVNPGPDDAGAVSQRFWTSEDMAGKGHDWPPEWGVPIPLPPSGLQLSMALQKGYTLYGRLVDEHDRRKPLSDVLVDTWNDLNVDTHTGYGGQIFQNSVKTDANGEFKLQHLYDAKLYLRFGGLWMSTARGGTSHWVPQDENVLDPPIDPGMRIDCGVILHPDFHYTGTVIDAQGQPVANADVVVGISHEAKGGDYSDTHHFERTKTDAQGRYDLAASSPWGTFLESEDPTHGRVDLKWPNSNLPSLPPGKYDLQFPAQPAPAR